MSRRGSSQAEQNVSPLKSIQQRNADLSEKVTKFLKSLDGSNTVSSPERRQDYNSCSKLKAEVVNLQKETESLAKKNESNPPKDFNNLKKAELQNLADLKMNRSVRFEEQAQIDRVSKQLEPDEVEEDYFRKVQTGSNSDLQSEDNDQPGSEEDEEDYDEESEEEEDEETEEEDTYTGEDANTVMVRNVEALSDFPGEQPTDLPFKKGDILRIIDPREDGWWLAENAEGKQGVVPKTLVKIIQDAEPRQDKKTPSGEADDQLDDLPSPKRRGQFGSELQATGRSLQYCTLAPILLTIKSGCEFIQSGPYVEMRRKGLVLLLRLNGKDLWKSLQKGSKQETSVTDVLKAMGAMPSGFKSTTLGKLAKKERFQTNTWVIPKLRRSHLGYRDMVWDPINRQLTPWPVKVTRVFTIVVARKIPLPGAGVDILCRHVRMALWDWRRKEILSNVHTVRATVTDKDPLTWSFTAKSATSMFDGECLARLNTTEDTIGILFELDILYVRSSTGEKSEVSCGWCVLKLYEETGAPIPNKTFEVTVNGGTPYDEGHMEVDQTVSMQETTNLFQSIVRTNQQPRLFIKLTSSNKATKDTQDTLPEILLTCNQYVPFISHYRQLVASTLLGVPRDIYDGELIADPVLSTFPSVLRTPDVMDTLKKRWDERQKKELNRSQRKSSSTVKNFFREVYMDSVYPVINSAIIPPFILGDENREKERLAWILDFERRSTLENLFSTDRLHKPFNLDRVTFNVLSKQAIM